MADLSYRAITPEEFDAFAAAGAVAFGETLTQEDLDEERPVMEFDRTIAAFDSDGGIVATASACTFEMTVPGGVGVPVGGLTWVSVMPTHRRRGVLTEMMRRHMDDCVERGEAASILLASESAIYGRFGYGFATEALRYTIGREHIDIDRAVFDPSLDGQVRFVSRDAALALCPQIWNMYRVAHAGELTRSEAWWPQRFSDSDASRGGASKLFFAVHRGSRGDDGYVAYRVKDGPGSDGIADNVVSVLELVAASDTAYAGLWSFVASLDLVKEIVVRRAPIDDSLRFMISDSRRAILGARGDFLWIRPLDPAALLAARAYQVDDRIVLRVTDPFYGSEHVIAVGGSGGAVAAPHERAVDLELGVDGLGSALLGGFRPSMLVAAGRARELTAGAAARADLLLLGDRAPFCLTGF